jgi:multiple sugar transport system substrate-binding protein
MRRASRAAVAGLLISLGMVGGCTTAASGTCGGDAPGPVTFATVKDLTDKQRDRLTQWWDQENPAEPLRIVELPARSDEQRSQLAATLQTMRRGGPAAGVEQSARRTGSPEPAPADAVAAGYDVVGLDVVFVREFAMAGHLQPLDQRTFPQASFLEKPWQNSVYGQTLYAVPFTTNVGLLYYWADELDRRGDITDVAELWQPKDWAAVQAVAEPRLADDDAPAGYAGQLGRYEGLTANVLELVWGFRGDLPTRDRDVSAGEVRAAADGIGFLIDGLEDGWIDEATLGFGEAESLDAFQRRGVLVLRHWPDAWKSLEMTPASTGVVRVTRLPGPSVLGGESIAVAACSPHRSSALKLVQFLSRPRTQLFMYTDGLYLPTRSQIYRDGTLEAEDVLPKETIEQVLLSLDEARPRPLVPDYLHTSRLIHEKVHGDLQRATVQGAAPKPDAVADQLAAALRQG